MRNKIKNIIKNILLVFVLVSIGYALGKFSVKNIPAPTDHKSTTAAVHVYYLHSTFRCSTCNTIEKMTKELLGKQFQNEIDSGRLLFSEVDFQKNEALANQFGVVSSCVVVAEEQNGEILDYKRIDEVWELKDKPEEFDDCISRIIKKFLGKVFSE